MTFGITLKIVKNAESGFLHHARKPPFFILQSIENAYSIDEMRFMLFFMYFLDFLAKHLAYLYDFTFLRTITQI